MNVTIITPIRNAAHKLPDYVVRADAIQWPARDNIRFIFVEGDSEDNTWDLLVDLWMQDKDRIRLIKCDTGARHHGSYVNAERFRTLATVFNAGLNAVNTVWTDAVLMLPVDIVYGPNLIGRLASWGKPCIAPFSFEEGLFYDTYCWRYQGSMMPKFPIGELRQRYGDKPIEMDTAGGTMLYRIEVVTSGVRYSIEDVDRGFTRQSKEAGYSVWADPTTIVHHPLGANMALTDQGERYTSATIPRLLEAVRMGRYTTADGVMLYPEGYKPGGNYDVREKDGGLVLYYKEPGSKRFEAIGVVPPLT